MKDLSGVFTALVTPFDGGQIDWQSLGKLIRHQLDHGINGLVICGTTGESPVLTDTEKAELFQFVRGEVAGQVPLVMGTGTNSTSETIRNTQKAEQLGADAALVVVPYYNKPPQRGLFQHFQAVASSCALPVILYNVPSRTVARLEADTIIELSRVKNVVGIKEATGDLEFGRTILEGAGREFLVTSGDDASFLELIGLGARGVISVASHIFPKEFVSWCRRARAGDVTAHDEFNNIVDLNAFLYIESNPIPIKAALHILGLIKSPELRLPLVSLSEPNVARLRQKMIEAGLL